MLLLKPLRSFSTGALLLSSLLLTIGRGMTLPFMTIYLNRQYGLDVHQVGVAMTIALTIGVAFSLGFGMLADRFDKKRYMLLAILAFLSGFVLIPLTHSVPLVVLFFSLINCAYAVFATVLKSYFSDTLAIAERPKIFSLNYTFINIGWTAGPPLGTLLVMYSLNLPFWLAALTAIPPLALIARFVTPVPVTRQPDGQPGWSPGKLLQDKALFWLTFSTFLGQLVFGSFTSCLSQYVMAVYDINLAQQVVAVVLPVNAAVVVSLQYSIGKRLRQDNLRRLMFYASLCFAAGLVGFMLSGTSLVMWGCSMVVFTLGELIYSPGEYMLLDSIAPPGMKASYFSAQTLGTLGGAFNPLLTGYLLTWLPAWTLFIALILLVGLAYLTMLKGMRAGGLDLLQK
ncbi:efflux MFS transporter YdeE [Entomohabitans teleogrylli]|uniref:efflux MFS transporter YdeE n=1 Tax=Entomohabitans teleogrylli TaxID=1384589 RepID=UPI00073DA24B|nr:efflux MFS transporter YdeE [Entomohabitans teleogrylli]